MNATNEHLGQSQEISASQTLKTFARLMTYFAFFKMRIAAKLSFITFEHTFRLLLVPWPLKIIVDHVILGEPVAADGTGFPSYMAPIMGFLSSKTAEEIMFWMLLIGVFMVILIGMTPNRGTGRNASGSYTGAAAGSLGNAKASLAEGQDTATQTENASNSAGSEMGGILGLLDFKIHLRLTQSLNHLVRTELADHIKSLPVTTLEDQRIGDSVYRVIYDSTSATGIYEALTMGLYSGILMVALTLYIMFTSFGSAPEVIIVGILVGPMTFLFVIPFARLARQRSQASRISGAQTTSNIEEGMSNVLAIQSLGGNKRESKRFAEDSSESFRRFRAEAIVKLIYQHAGALSFMIGQIIYFVLIAGHVIEGNFTAGDYFVVFYYFFVLSAVFYSFGFLYTELQGFIAGLVRVFNLLDLDAEKTTDGIELPEIKRGVTFNNVGLTYPDGRKVLNDISLDAQLGEIIALVGPTGAGKTSLAYLVPAFVQATTGTVSIDGVDLKDVSVESLRKQVSYVFQETQLFSDSILDNIRYGNRSASIDEVQAAATIAGAHEFITELPEGYHTNLGTVTSKLSVGQKQRISIARGLIKDSRILILDEPTSALDPETEAYLIDALHEAAKEKLVVIIAHRLSTIAHADRIYFLEAGAILESGSHDDLMSMSEGRYRAYVELQAGELADS